jgi:hypothetical protein
MTSVSFPTISGSGIMSFLAYCLGPMDAYYPIFYLRQPFV